MGLFKVLGFTVSLVVFASTATALDTYQLANKESKIDTKDFAHLQSLVATKSFASPEAFLTTWKSERPDFFDNYILGYRSRSLQKSTPMYPRAIIFNKNADLVMSFNGHKEHKGFNNLEMMRFNHDGKAFEFYEMSFSGGKAQLSEVNPKKCLACHQSMARGNVDPRPNWEPYNNWPGFYGSLDDNTELFKDSALRGDDFDPIIDAVILNEIQNETAWLYDFQSTIQKTHPRYSLLKSETTDQYGKINKTLNGDLTNRLASLNFQRVARLIRNLPADVYAFAKWGIWAHAACGQTLSVRKKTFEWLYQQAPNNDYSRYAKRNPPVPTYQRGSHFEMGEYKIKYTPPEFVDGDASDAINIFIEAAGVSTEDWSMDFKTDGARFAAFERFGLTNDPRPPWSVAIKDELSQDPELSSLDCDTVKQKAQALYGNLETLKVKVAQLKANRSEAVPQKPLIQRCMNCHSPTRINGDGTPMISFHDAEKLKAELKKSGYKRGTLLEEIRYRIGAHATEEEQMPKGGVPTSRQKEELLKYLESL